jgi:hypothetical protein
MILVLVIILIILVISLYLNPKITEFFSDPRKPRELSSFTNFNLTDKPVANYAPYNIYQWWKYGDHFSKYKHCDQYRCQTPQFNAYNAKPCFNLVKGRYCDPSKGKLNVHFKNAKHKSKYFDNATDYCLSHPHDERCPNNWLKL